MSLLAFSFTGKSVDIQRLIYVVVPQIQLRYHLIPLQLCSVHCASFDPMPCRELKMWM